MNSFLLSQKCGEWNEVNDCRSETWLYITFKQNNFSLSELVIKLERICWPSALVELEAAVVITNAPGDPHKNNCAPTTVTISDSYSNTDITHNKPTTCNTVGLHLWTQSVDMAREMWITNRVKQPAVIKGRNVNVIQAGYSTLKQDEWICMIRLENNRSQ